MMSAKKRYIGATATIATTLLLTTACGSTAGSESADVNELTPTADLVEGFDPEAHFSYMGSYPPSSFDPFTSASGLDQTYLAPIYDRLLYNSPSSGELEPMLAESFEVSGSDIVLKLRPGLSYTDGTPFDAASVKKNIDRYKSDGSTVAIELAHVESAEVIDDLTIKLTTDGAVGAATAALSARAGMMVSPQSIDAGNVETEPVGIGPYTAISVTPGQGVKLERTEGYWDPDAQRVATMDLSGVGENQTRQNAVSSGESLAAEIPATSMAPLESTAGFLKGPTPLVYFVGLNTSEGSFDDVRVRQAISMAIDRESISEGLFQGACEPQLQFLPSNSFGYNSELGSGLEAQPFDPEAASALLDEAGFTDESAGFSMVHTNNTSSTQLGEVIQAQLAEVGITVKPSPVPSGGIVENFGIEKSMPMTMSGYTGAPDPDAFIQRNWTLDSVYNPGGYSDPVVDELAAAGASAEDQEGRATAYQELNAHIVETPTHIIPICASNRIVAYDERVSGLTVGGDYQDVRGVAVAAE